MLDKEYALMTKTQIEEMVRERPKVYKLDKNDNEDRIENVNFDASNPTSSTDIPEFLTNEIAKEDSIEQMETRLHEHAGQINQFVISELRSV